MRRLTKLLVLPLLVVPVSVAGVSLAFTGVASAKAPKIVCTSLSGNYITQIPVTVSGCTNGPSGETSNTSPFTECQSSCTNVATWSDGTTQSTESYNAPDKTGKAAVKKCKDPNAIAYASETGTITSGYGAGGKLKATICVDSSTGDLSLAPGTTFSM